MNTLDLKDEWITLLQLSNVQPENGQAFFKSVCSAYSEPHRYYHTLAHISEILSLLKQSNQESLPNLWATWFHDIVYVPGKANNEAVSADQAKEVMTSLGVELPIIETTTSLILATKTHESQGCDESAKTFLDADMAILGAPPERYTQYYEEVQKEYRSIPGFLYRRGRAKFLKHLQEQDSIYLTSWFSERFENQARINISNEVKSL